MADHYEINLQSVCASGNFFYRVADGIVPLCNKSPLCHQLLDTITQNSSRILFELVTDNIEHETSALTDSGMEVEYG